MVLKSLAPMFESKDAKARELAKLIVVRLANGSVLQLLKLYFIPMRFVPCCNEPHSLVPNVLQWLKLKQRRSHEPRALPCNAPLSLASDVYCWLCAC